MAQDTSGSKDFKVFNFGRGKTSGRLAQNSGIKHGKVFHDLNLPNGKKLSTMREDVFRAAVDATRKK